MKWNLAEVFSARLLHILVIAIIKTMVMFNNSPKGSEDWAVIGWGRSSFQSSGTSSFWNGLEYDAPSSLSGQSEAVWRFQEVYMQCPAGDRGQDSADVSIAGCFVDVAITASASSCI